MPEHGHKGAIKKSGTERLNYPENSHEPRKKVGKYRIGTTKKFTKM